MRYAKFYDVYARDGQHKSVVDRANTRGLEVVDVDADKKVVHDSPVLYWMKEGCKIHYAIESGSDVLTQRIAEHILHDVHPEFVYSGSFDA